LQLDKGVYGDIGYVENVEPDDSEMVVVFDGRSVTYGFGERRPFIRAKARSTLPR
jgi:exodeoxyribonuclease V alpha subunit